MLKWLKQHEQQGDFKITDSKLHEAFYSYWKANQKSRHFLDKRRIQMNFFIRNGNQSGRMTNKDGQGIARTAFCI